MRHWLGFFAISFYLLSYRIAHACQAPRQDSLRHEIFTYLEGSFGYLIMAVTLSAAFYLICFGIWKSSRRMALIGAMCGVMGTGLMLFRYYYVSNFCGA